METGRRVSTYLLALITMGLVNYDTKAQNIEIQHRPVVFEALPSNILSSDTSQQPKSDIPSPPPTYHNVWGLDILISNDGFGLGTFYRREFSSDLFGFASFSISESKDEREFERYDPFINVSFSPGKLRRFLVMPLLFGIQYRLFREDITETFRPYVNAGAGPTMIFSAPFAEVRQIPGGGI
ncbi:MAG: hypothetical protein HY708_01005, partial [Ignavibacteriae bacterium]|nr:hypothetical protein [Ignavibacteriota bacterium]